MPFGTYKGQSTDPLTRCVAKQKSWSSGSLSATMSMISVSGLTSEPAVPLYGSPTLKIRCSSSSHSIFRRLGHVAENRGEGPDLQWIVRRDGNVMSR